MDSCCQTVIINYIMQIQIMLVKYLELKGAGIFFEKAGGDGPKLNWHQLKSR